MKHRIMKKLTILIVLLCISHSVNAQKVDIVKLEITNGQLLGGDENLFMIGFRVQTEEQFTGVSEKSKVLSFVDNNSFDMLKANKSKKKVERTGSTNRLIVFDESRPLPDNKGFLLVIRSWVLPSENAKEVQLKAEIIFNIMESDSLEASNIENMVFRDAVSFPWQGKAIPVKQRKYRDSVKGEVYRYELQNEDLGVAVQKIEQLDANGNVIKKIELYLYPAHVEFSLQEIDKPINLKISYKNLNNKTVTIDTTVDLGL
jgi:hypothetical protein